VAGLAHFSTYSSSHGRLERSCSHVPDPDGRRLRPHSDLVVDPWFAFCSRAAWERPLTALLGIALALALAYHVVSSLRDDDEHCSTSPS